MYMQIDRTPTINNKFRFELVQYVIQVIGYMLRGKIAKHKEF